MVTLRYRHGRCSDDHYEFLTGGDEDIYHINFVSDKLQGLGVPAKSLSVSNHAGGAGYNYLYYRLNNGKGWDKTARVEPDQTVNYAVEDGGVYVEAMFWASNANLEFSFLAMPGVWTLKELREYIPSPAVTIERKLVTEEDKWGQLQSMLSSP